MLKRVFAICLSAALLCTTFITIMAAEPVSGGAVVSEFMVDECADFSKVYSCTGFEQSDAAVLDADTYPDYQDTNAWQLTVSGGSGEVVYKAADGKLFNYIKMEFSRSGNSIYPKIEYSADNSSWTTLSDSTDEAWNRTIGGDADTFLGHAIRENKMMAIPVDDGAKYVKISVTGDADAGKDQLLFRNITLGVNGSVSESITDTCADFSNVWSSENLSVYSGEADITQYGEADGKVWYLADGATGGEVVYHAADGVVFNDFKMEFSQSKGYPYTFPAITYSADGQIWETLVETVTNSIDSNAPAGWKKDFNAGDGNKWQYGYSNINTAIPGAKEAKWIKVSIPFNSSTWNHCLIKNMTIGVTPVTTVSSSIVDECADFSNVLSVSGLQQADPSETDALSNEKYNDSTAWQMNAVKADAEIVYKAADGKLFQAVEFDFSKSIQIVYPQIDYKTADGEWKTLVATDETLTWSSDLWNTSGGGEDYAWHVINTNKTTVIPEGAKYVRIRIAGSKSAQSKIDQILIRSIKLDVIDETTVFHLSVDETGTATVSVTGPNGVSKAVLFIAEYDSESRLVNVGRYDLDITNNAPAITKKLDAVGENPAFKAFLWDSADSLKPLVKVN